MAVSIREQLTAAACALVGIGAPATSRAADVDASLLYYSEGTRVTVNELVGRLRRTLAGERVFHIGATLDVMTGASATGAVPSREPQTFTRASGRGGYVVLPGETPLDDTFQDNRIALDAALETPLGRMSTAQLGARVSSEYDYRSAGANARVIRDFNRHNTTLAAGGSFSYDRIAPEGGIPVPFATMRAPGQTPARLSKTDHKLVADALVSLSQVIDRNTIARVNYSVSHSGGYQTDPFKILSLLDADGSPLDYLYERRPDTRTRQSFYGELKRHIAHGALGLSYRYMRDDWGVRSHTAEARYRHRFGERHWVEPQYRFYHQSEADFYTPYLAASEPRPDYASADYRLGTFDAHTIALKVGWSLSESNEVGVRVGYYKQMGERAPPAAMDALAGFDLFPDVDAYMIQVGYARSIP